MESHAKISIAKFAKLKCASVPFHDSVSVQSPKL